MKPFIRCLIIVLSFASLPAQATLISINGNLFKDTGKSTIDSISGLEWLDVTETQNRSYFDVFNDINDDGGAFDIIDGWRFATWQELLQLQVNWFGFTNGFIYEFLSNVPGYNEPDMNLFTATFGDTGIEEFEHPILDRDSTIIGYENYARISGITTGYYAPTDSNPNKMRWAFFRDGEYISTANVSVTGRYRDIGDSVRIAHIHSTVDGSAQSDFGSFLVRQLDSSAVNRAIGVSVNVSAPNVSLLAALAIFCLLPARAFRQTNFKKTFRVK